jgi:predicted NAD/FAD-binding protein
MSTREELDLELKKLGEMLPIWLEKLRHPAEFWPQFDALAQAILDNSSEADASYVRRRLELLLQRHGLKQLLNSSAPTGL